MKIYYISSGFLSFKCMLFGAEDAAEFNCWPQGLMPLFSQKHAAHGSGCQDVAIKTVILPLPPLSHTPAWTRFLWFPMSYTEKQLEVLQDIADLTVKAMEQALFKCEVSDDKVTGKWYKDGVEVLPSERIKMTHIGRYKDLWMDSETFVGYFVVTEDWNIVFKSQSRSFPRITSSLVSGFIGCLLMMWSQRTLETIHLFLMDTPCHFLPNSTSWVRETQ